MRPRAAFIFEGRAMTCDEFRQQYEAYEWDPYSPLAVILATGNRVYIDMPEQVTLTDDELVITRRKNPRKPERYRYADIARLVPLMELPADPGGMSYAEFDAIMRELIVQRPFSPFVVELRSGERIEVTKAAPRGGRFMKVWSDVAGPLRSIEFHDIARIVTTAAIPSA
jgi:hypothetical protein